MSLFITIITTYLLFTTPHKVRQRPENTGAIDMFTFIISAQASKQIYIDINATEPGT